MKKLKKMVKVENMVSSRGNLVPNQFEIRTNDGVYFQSYETVIAFRDNKGQVTLNTDYSQSTTTGKFRNAFLGDSGVAETRKKVKQGIYKVANLN